MVNAMNSIILIQDEMLKTALPLLIEHNKEKHRSGGHNLDFGEPQTRKKGTLEERLTILSVAYHNYAVELEYLNKVGLQSDFSMIKACVLIRKLMTFLTNTLAKRTMCPKT
jgi:hypothetical protein